MRRFEKIAYDARGCARFYREKPGLVSASAVVDLYQSIALLAEMLDGGETVDSPHPAQGTEKYQTFKEAR